MRRVAALLALTLTLIYPLTIWLGEGRMEPRFLAGALLLAGLTRLFILTSTQTIGWWLAGTLGLVILAIWFNASLPLKLYPVFVNMALLGIFLSSLFAPPTIIERWARLREGRLPAAAIDYTRKVTQVWCGFFAVNGALALFTALWASAAVWTLYNGLIAYVLMGVLFAGEYFVRRHYKQRYHV